MPPKVAGQTYCLQKLERATTTVDVPKTLLKCQSLSDQGSLGAKTAVSVEVGTRPWEEVFDDIVTTPTTAQEHPALPRS